MRSPTVFLGFAGGVLLTVVALAMAMALAPGGTGVATSGRAGLGLALPLLLLAVLAIARAVAVSAAKEHQAFHDPLTDLPNRACFRRCLDELIDEGDHSRSSVAVLLIDLDRFKEVNDTLGHDAGDSLLLQIGPRLAESLGGDGVIARLGGDEFGVALTGVTTAAAARLEAARLVAGLERPFPVDGALLDVEASIGIALHPDHGSTTETLLQRADIAMYLAKARQHAVEVYAPEHDRHSRRRLGLLADLRTALGNGELVVHYQPQVNLRTGRVETVEALVRWQHPRDGLLSPGDFVPLAERTGLIRPLTTHVLAVALRQAARWRARGLDLAVSVNLSARNLHDPLLSRQVADVLDHHGLPARHLQLEITESSIMDDAERAATVLASLHELGVRLSIDDFGTGYSSLAYLQRLPVNEIKIDRSFVSGMAQRTADEVIVHSTIDLARNLGLTVTAEGVESETVLRLLREGGCNSAQGYFISPAVPAPELESLLERESWAGGVAAGLARGQRSLFDPDPGDDPILDLAGDPTIDLGHERHPSRRAGSFPAPPVR